MINEQDGQDYSAGPWFDWRSGIQSGGSLPHVEVVEIPDILTSNDFDALCASIDPLKEDGSEGKIIYRETVQFAGNCILNY